MPRKPAVQPLVTLAERVAANSTALANAQDALVDALRSGADTRPARHRIAELEVEARRLVIEQDEAEGEAARLDAERLDRQAAEIADGAAQRIHGALTALEPPPAPAFLLAGGQQ